VLLSHKKNIGLAITGKRTLLFLLFFLPAFVQAQTDTVILSDTLIPEVTETPAEEPRTVEVSTDDTEKKEFFLNKYDFTADSSILQRHLPDSLVTKMQQDDDFWYANAEIKEEIKPEESKSSYIPLGRREWFQTLIWLVIIVGFAAAIMWYLAGSNVGLFRRKNKYLQNTGEEELETDDIFAINYQKEIDKAEANGNFRLAIRLMFLRVLKVMAEKNIIEYKQGRTNFDYLLQLQPTGYYNNFFRITRNYEYSWYGKFEVGEGAYRMIRNDFTQFDRQLT
jgi:hypothetical protein